LYSVSCPAALLSSHHRVCRANFCLFYTEFHQFATVLLSANKVVKERIEGGANEKAALRFPITALSFASISIFPG
jgi:hypothetical protein